MDSHSSVSSTIVAANKRLLMLRQQRGGGSKAHFPSPKQQNTAPASSREQSVSPAFFSLPSHLGWESSQFSKLLTQQSKFHTKQEPDGSSYKDTKESSFPLQSPEELNKTKDRTKVHRQHIRHYPSLGIAALQNEQAALYRVWLACRLLDAEGSGWLNIATIRPQLTASDAPLRLFGWRRLRQTLHQGNGRFWLWDQQQKRLWLFGAARVASSILSGRKLTGVPVLLPITTLTNGIGCFKAHLYAAWHSGRQTENPISREAQSALTSVPQRTQRHYEKQAGVQVTPNYAVGEAYSSESLKQHTWRKGGAVFQFVDKRGRLGKRNGRYIAWQLPNSYSGPHQKAAWGNQRKINQQLIDLVHKGAQGNGEPVERRYFQHGAAAAKAINKQTCIETYWPLQKKKNKQQLWSAFF